MIYEFTFSDSTIRQGDIFYPLPKLYTGLNKLFKFNNANELEETTWENEKDTIPFNTITRVETTWGIVASQDCDAARSPSISFFKIDTLESISKPQLPSNPEKAIKTLLKKCREANKWFYLPIDQTIGFHERMAIDFQNIFQIESEFLTNNIHFLRKGRLNAEADEHYRESIAQFFRRYPYDEWYPLSKDEFELYSKSSDEHIEPRNWQK